MNKILIALISLCVASCTKIEAIHTDNVQVRIENVTGLTLENAQVGGTSYGDVTNHQLTDYKMLSTPIYAGYCAFNVSGVQSGAGVGVCGTSLPPPFEPGYYTFTITPGVSGYSELTVTKK